MEKPMKSALGILVLIVIGGGLFLFRDRILPSRGSVCRPHDANVGSLGSALKTYRLNAGVYPTTEQGLKALIERPDTPPFRKRWVKIADKIPLDPWMNEHRYRLLPEGSENNFEIFSAGKDGTFGTPDDLSSLLTDQ